MVQKSHITSKNEDGLLREITYIPSGESVQFKPENEKVNKRETIFLYFVIYMGLLPLVAGGAHVVWLSPAYSSLVSNNSAVNPLSRPATTAEISMIGGVPALVGLLGPFLMTKMMDKIGRKMSLQITALMMFLSNLGQVFCNQAIYIIIMRCGVMGCFSAYSVIVLVYIGEICEPHNKAKYLCFMGVCMPLGNMYAYYLGPILHYRVFTFILTVPLLPFLVLFFFAPDTPVYYLSRGQKQECFIALKKLRSNKCSKELEQDLNLIADVLKGTKSSNDKGLSYLLKTKQARIGTALSFLLGATAHFCGISSIMTFLGPLLLEAGTNLSENTMTVIVPIIQSVCILCTSLFVGKVGRKILLVSSCLGCGVPLLIWGIFYQLKYSHSPYTSSLQWVPMFAVIALNIMFSLGIGSVFIIVVSELFPSDLISAAVSFTIIVVSTTAALITMAYPFVATYCGVNWCMWIFSLNSFACAAALYLFLPETKGKTVVEVQEILNNY